MPFLQHTHAIPRVAIIGGGIFGVTAALVLGKEYEVTLFERRDDIIGGATYANQYRHHWGYHYPRSRATIAEVRRDLPAFEDFYRSAIRFGNPSYYCIAREGSRVSADEFLRMCAECDLPYRQAYPPSDFLNVAFTSCCIETPEAFYDYDRLKSLLHERLTANENIHTELTTAITSARVTPTGLKVLKIAARGKGEREQEFDYLINATYANYNNVCRWLGFPQRELLLRLKELPVIKLPTDKKISVTIMDGPFATMIPTGRSGVYTFGDVPLSVHEEHVSASANELEVRLSKLKTRWPQMQQRCADWFPIIREAEHLYSMFVILPIDPPSDALSDRPTDIVYHGEGCWSILSGKIVSAVSTAQRIFTQMQLL
jgi:hypothetical protein